MYNYIKDSIGSAPSDMNRVALDPKKSKLFTVLERSSLLGVAQAELIHSMTSILLFVVKRARPNT